MLRLLSVILIFALPAPTPAKAQETVKTSAGTVIIEPVLRGLNAPWAVGFLPDGGFLVTERDGRLLIAKSGDKIRAVSGVPKVVAKGQGGLLDVVVARDFAQSGEIFLSYSEPRTGGAATALAVARLDAKAARLTDLRVIFRMKHASRSNKHFGSRIVEARDGTLFLTIGDRGDRDLAQDPMRHNGKVIRVARDGSIPADNPFAKGGALPEIWSLGHRNPQGAALDLQGRFWTVAHGARGGDEVNRPEAGKNYGWPVISYGRHYTGFKIGVGTKAPGMEQPRYYWDPSIAPSGMMIYSGKLWPKWKGDIFIGALKFDYIARLEGNPLKEAEQLFRDQFIRIRDVREAPDGTIWFLAVGDDALYRIRPG
ncbi:PQQ-dependent sugar dehydrogenase [Aliiroseovarius sp. KMU-50]|uniref:PQQ-dependent sugar dehydrogenase n=1 Tax=Aliiroseovarius salicola TaxID=3009082 RepID=A0ABT4W4X5_9RHOB|nr:PQQ-dependent sugar dehydrogenase [Aliiroseovarius sp. KMU-50]MDA5095564.1 PQQ-dependent sugar dehydrogenase [Aliiroseovarius sp. KMU-50]